MSTKQQVSVHVDSLAPKVQSALYCCLDLTLHVIERRLERTSSGCHLSVPSISTFIYPSPKSIGRGLFLTPQVWDTDVARSLAYGFHLSCIESTHAER